tara:strand:- start:336 stop:1220 length:885 start_codon:yes stop_codon:yes gene_type:complete
MRSRNTSDKIKLSLKGILMGIAEALPGISGGTIALLVGIYKELIMSISEIDISLYSELKNKGFKSFWKKLNGNFFLFLSFGTVIGLFFSVNVLASLLENYPLFIWSFFLGLVFATVYVIRKLINQWRIINFFYLFASIIFSLILSSFSIYESDEISLLFVLFSGIIASSAMILPGISGSLLLLILGVHAYIIKSINNILNLSYENIELILILVFISGALIGLLVFSRIVKYLFINYRDITYTVMLGLVIGSIEKVWPWNKSFSTELSNLNLLLSISLAVLGFMIVFLLEKNKKY